MHIITRQMEPGEALDVYRMGRRAFSGLEGFGIPKPRQAIVAEKDGRIVGAIQYKYYRAGGKKIGYFDYAFTDPDCHGQGVGTILYKAAAEYLWERGCDALTALVKDDNVGSWALFLKNGFARISVPELVRQFGFFGMLRLYCGTVYGIAIGMHYYVALRDKTCPSGKGGGAGQITAYLLVNLLLSLFMLIRGMRDSAFFVAYGIFLAGGIAAGYAGTLLSKRGWRFRLCNGGCVVSALVNAVGGPLPMVGNWYPELYEKTEGFRKDMGVQALAGWVFVFALTLLSTLAAGRHMLFQYLESIGSVFLLYRAIAIYPFEAFGGGRVYQWKKGVYFLTTAATLAYFLYLFIM